MSQRQIVALRLFIFLGAAFHTGFVHGGAELVGIVDGGGDDLVGIVDGGLSSSGDCGSTEKVRGPKVQVGAGGGKHHVPKQ